MHYRRSRPGNVVKPENVSRLSNSIRQLTVLHFASTQFGPGYASLDMSPRARLVQGGDYIDVLHTVHSRVSTGPLCVAS
jgi:hypothetical protein